MSDSHTILELNQVGKQFNTLQGPLVILENVSCKISKGEKVAIIGPSGSGKSTLLSIIGLLDTPSTGSLMVDGTDPTTLTESAQATFRNEHIGFIFQSFELIAPFTVEENIVAPLEIGNSLVRRDELATLLQNLRLTDRADAMPQTLSGGEKQRTAIGRALLNKPTLILADEPTGSLDRATGEKVLALLLDQVALAGASLILITHDESIAERMDRVFELHDKSLHERR